MLKFRIMKNIRGVMHLEEKNNLPVYYFHEGTNYSAYEYLGCNLTRDGDKYIYSFRTWAPNARAVSLVSEFTDWDRGIDLKRISAKGVWELIYSSDTDLRCKAYKFRILTQDSRVLYKGDPYARFSKSGSDGASLIAPDSNFEWGDSGWFRHRADTVCVRDGEYLAAPLNIYEVHLGSFSRHEDGSFLSYRELADELVPYVKSMGYTHIELLPVMEFPFDGSWGYQVCALYAPTSRFGDPDDFRYFVDSMHRAGIGVILDWVPAHFPKDGWGLYEFDGQPLYEYQGDDRKESRSWGTRFFDLGREEVQCFLISNALYWLGEFHADGLRVDAVSSMLYLDYDRSPGEWIPNKYGDNRNLEAIAFLQKLNSAVFAKFPDALMVAEESTSFEGVTHPVSEGGLGFNLKWNMGWANDFYKYIALDSVYRKYHHDALNFPIMYAYRENYILPISHDEVVHGKCSFINKMSGTYEEKFLQVRASLMMMMTYPGKKLLFMGTEYGQFREWNFSDSLEWFMLDYPMHYALREYTASLNRFYLENPALWEKDFDPSGFTWIYPDLKEQNLIAFRRNAICGDSLIVVISFSGADNNDFRLPVGECEKISFVFDSNGAERADIVPEHDEGGCYIKFNIPKFSGVILKEINTQGNIEL